MSVLSLFYRNDAVNEKLSYAGGSPNRIEGNIALNRPYQGDLKRKHV